jgi:hypothetical protein
LAYRSSSERFLQQSARVSALLRKGLEEHEDEVIDFGYDSVNNIGLHLI